MKRLNKLLLLFLSLLLIFSLAIGCSAKESQSFDSGVTENASPGEFDRPMEEESTYDISPLEPEKVITTINMYFETTEFVEANESLNKIIEKHKSYVENSNISHNQHYNSKSYRYGYFVIRVPKENVANFKADLKGIGNIISESTNKEDVTKKYRDTESRLKVITTKEERILALLEKAEKIEDIIALENQLSETIAEKEILKTSLMNIDDKVDFSTINIEIQEVEKLSNAETIETTFGTRIKNAFSNSLFRFKKSMENLVISLIYLLPFILVLGVVVYLVYIIIKKLNIRHKKS